MPAPEVTGVDERILETIDAMRVKFRACTARQVAGAMKVDHSYISRRIQLLAAHGLVGFDARIPGSIHRLGTAECREVDGVWTPVGATVQLPSADAPAPVIKLGVDPERAAAAAARRAAVKPAPVKKAAKGNARAVKRANPAAPKKATAPR